MNKKGNVPTLVLEDGSVLNENVAVLTYLSQQGSGEASLGYPSGTPGYYRMLNATAFIASELHSTLGVLFYPVPSDEARHMRMHHCRASHLSLAAARQGGSTQTLTLHAHVAVLAVRQKRF